MRGGPVRARMRLVIYPVAVSLLILVGNAAYASPSASVVPAGQQGQPAQPIATVEAQPIAISN